jgi:hypothetical protein
LRRSVPSGGRGSSDSGIQQASSAPTELAPETPRSLQQPPGEPQVLTHDEDHLTATWGPVYLTVWKKEVRVDAARAIQFALRDFAASTPGGRVACLTVIEEGAPLPSADARTALANMFRFWTDDLICSGVAMMGTGFRAAAVRGVATGLSLIARQPFPHRTWASIPLAASWICSLMKNESPLAFGPNDLVAAAEKVRSGGAALMHAHARLA